MLQTAGAVTLWDLDWPPERRIGMVRGGGGGGGGGDDDDDDAPQEQQLTRDGLLRQLDSDLAWLESVKIMDYSLLVGVEDPPSPGSALPTIEAAQLAGRCHFVAQDGRRYHLGLIDLLQYWSGVGPCTCVCPRAGMLCTLGTGSRRISPAIGRAHEGGFIGCCAVYLGGKQIEGWAKGLFGSRKKKKKFTASPSSPSSAAAAHPEVTAVAPDVYRQRLMDWVQTIIVESSESDAGGAPEPEPEPEPAPTTQRTLPSSPPVPEPEPEPEPVADPEPVSEPEPVS
jgi:hypothetical protein